MPFIKSTESKTPPNPINTRKIFVGRADELNFFVEKILKPEDPAHNIISISGQGGVGKSSLVDRFIDEARASNFKDYCLTATVNERQTTPISIMERFAEQLHLEGEFEKAITEYKDALRKLNVDRNTVREAFWRKTTTDIASAATKSVPVVGGLLEKGTESAIEYLFDELHYHDLLKNAEQLEDPISNLTRAFIRELNRLTETHTPFLSNREKRQQRVILFFDTFEQLTHEAVPWLLNYFLPSNISNNVVLVIAGRDSLDRSVPNNPKRWLPYFDDNTIHSLSLDSFTEEETRIFLAERGITDSDKISTIWQLSRGLPLFLSLLTSNPRGDIDPTADVVANFLLWIPEQETVKRRLALDTALLSRPFNQDDMDAFTYLPKDQDEQNALYCWLVELPFVYCNPEDGRHSYHNIVQELFSRYLSRRSQKEYHASRRKLADYYHAILKRRLSTSTEESDYSGEWLEITLALAYQLFSLPDKTTHIKAIEQILYAYKNTKQTELILRKLRELSQGQYRDQINSNACQIAGYLSQYIEADSINHQRDLLKAVSILLEKIAQDKSFSKELLAYLYHKQGKAYHLLKQYHQALVSYNHAIELNSGNARILFDRGVTYQKMQRHEEALRDLDHAIEKDPTLEHTCQDKKGEIFLSMQNNEKAIDAYLKAILADPLCFAAWEELGHLYRKQYPPHEIPERLRAVRLPDTDMIQVIANRAKLMNNLGLNNEALSELDQAIKLNQADTQIFIIKGEINAELHRYEEALADFNHAIDLKPSNTRAINGRGSIYLSMKHYEDALVDFNKVIQLYSDADNLSKEERIERLDRLYIVTNQRGKIFPYRSLDIAIYLSGEIYRIMQQYEKALTYYNRAIELDSENAEAFFGRGKNYFAMKSYEEALRDLSRAIQLNSGFEHIGHKERGHIFLTIGEYNKAADAFIKAIAAHTACEGCWTSLASIYFSTHSQTEVARLLREIPLPSNTISSIVCRTKALYNIGLYDEALVDFTSAIQHDPDNSQAYINRSKVYKELRRYKEALADYERAIELAKSVNKNVWNEQGLLLSYLGRYIEAMESYQRTLQEDPADYTALYNLSVLMIPYISS